MTFTTVQGSGANDATSYVGSSGVDSITITNATAGTYLAANASGDFISYNTTFLEPNVLTGAVWYGGQGADSFVDLGSGNANANFVLLTSSVIYANKDADIIGATGAGITAVTSSIYGGQGADAINLANVSSTMVQGNKDADTITANGTIYANTSIYAGQGNDSVILSNVAAAQSENYTNVVISLDNDNDSFSLGGTIASFTGSSVLGGQGNDTIDANNAGTSFIIDGGAGNDRALGGNQTDTITSGDGNDTITGNGGGDSITFGSGAMQMVQAAAADTGTVAAVGAAAVTLTGLTTGNGFDVVSGLGSGDILDLTAFGTTANATIVNSSAGLAAASLANTMQVIRGTYNAGTFTSAAGGADTVILYNTATGNTTNIRGVVLQGYNNPTGSTETNGIVTLS